MKVILIKWHPSLTGGSSANIIQHMLNYLSSMDMELLAERLKVLAEPKRLQIFNLLMEGVQCNCELGDSLQMPPNLISHHLSKLRAVGLVDVKRDAVDSRWVYYSVNRAALDELNSAFGMFFNPQRIQPRRPNCGPKIISINESRNVSEKATV